MFRFEELPGAIVLEVHGEVDISNSCAFQDAIAVAKSKSTVLVVSLEKCSYLDTSTLGVLLRTAKIVGDRLWIVAPHDSKAFKLFILAGVRERFQIVPAVRDVARPAPLEARESFGRADRVFTSDEPIRSRAWQRNHLMPVHDR